MYPKTHRDRDLLHILNPFSVQTNPAPSVFYIVKVRTSDFQTLPAPEKLKDNFSCTTLSLDLCPSASPKFTGHEMEMPHPLMVITLK